jgi:hypothetical protein
MTSFCSPSFSLRARCVRWLVRHFAKISNPKHHRPSCHRLPCCRCPTNRHYHRHHPLRHRPPRYHRPTRHHCCPRHCCCPLRHRPPPAAWSQRPRLHRYAGHRCRRPAPLRSLSESPPARVTRHPWLTGSPAPTRTPSCCRPLATTFGLPLAGHPRQLPSSATLAAMEVIFLKKNTSNLSKFGCNLNRFD